MYLLTPFILQNFLKKFLEPIQGYEDVPFYDPKWPNCPEQIFLEQNIIITFTYLLALFIVQNLKKFLADPELRGCVIFGPKMSICPKQNFFCKIINIILIHLIAPFILQSFKKIILEDPELRGYAIFGAKMAHFPKWEFFQKTC